MSGSAVVLMSGPYVIGVGSSDKVCKRCGSTGKARDGIHNGIHIRAIAENPAEWIADKFPILDDAQAWVVVRTPHYQTYQPVGHSVLDALVSAEVE